MFPHVLFVANRLIEKDEEITIHYGGGKEPSVRTPCFCDSPNCCGFVPFSVFAVCWNHISLSIRSIPFAFRGTMEDKKEKQMKSVFDDESEPSEPEDINQLHVNKEYKER